MFQVSEVSKWQNNRRSIEPAKRKFSNFLTLPTSHLFPADPSKSGQDHFDLSSDEEDTSEKNRSQPVQVPVFGVPAISTPADDEETFFRSRLAETENRKYSTSTVLSDAESTLTERKDSIVSDAKFDLILASLQSLAIEIERDFRSDCENPDASVQRTKSENNLVASAEQNR